MTVEQTKKPNAMVPAILSGAIVHIAYLVAPETSANSVPWIALIFAISCLGFLKTVLYLILLVVLYKDPIMWINAQAFTVAASTWYAIKTQSEG